MDAFDRQCTVRVPLEEVWNFHSTPAGLEALTPGWMNLRIESTIGPDGEPDPAVLEAGSELTASIRPFGVGPRQYWTSEIVDREREEGAAYFRDRMVYGPFEEWIHTHAFFADGERTTVRDHVAYQLPFGPIGRLGTPFSKVAFEAMFRERHRRTRRELEG